MNKFLLISIFLFILPSHAGSYSLFCQGELASGAKISFDREDFTKITPVTNKSSKQVGQVLATKINQEGDLSPKNQFSFKGYEYQKGTIDITEIISESSWEDGGKACKEGHAGGQYGSSKVLKAIYNDFETPLEIIILTCTDEGAYSGNCQY